MATTFPVHIDQKARLAEQILTLLQQRGRRSPMRTAEIAEALPLHSATAIRASLGRMEKRGEIESPMHGRWRPTLSGGRPAYRPGHPRAEAVLPGTATEDLAAWAANIQEANPIGTGSGPFDPTVELIVDNIFMGVELTFVAGERKVFSLALFADLATADEEATMEAENER